jgi:hypothetical protein
MSGVSKFPGVPTSKIHTERGREEVHAQAFLDIEGDVCDLERTGAITHDLIMECSAREDGSRQLELATFAVWQLAKMTKEFKESYYQRFEGKLVGSS